MKSLNFCEFTVLTFREYNSLSLKKKLVFNKISGCLMHNPITLYLNTKDVYGYITSEKILISKEALETGPYFTNWMRNEYGCYTSFSKKPLGIVIV